MIGLSRLHVFDEIVLFMHSYGGLRHERAYWGPSLPGATVPA